MFLSLRLYRMILTVSTYLLPCAAFEGGYQAWLFLWGYWGRPASYPRGGHLGLLLLCSFVWAFMSEHYSVTSVNTNERVKCGSIGVALALGEVAPGSVGDSAILTDWSLSSAVRLGLQRRRIAVQRGARLRQCRGIAEPRRLHPRGDARRDRPAGGAGRHRRRRARRQIAAPFAKVEADPGGTVRGRRHTMLDDSDINHTCHARAVVGGVLAAAVGDPMIQRIRAPSTRVCLAAGRWRSSPPRSWREPDRCASCFPTCSFSG